MSKFDNPLIGLKVASPCEADWESMYGDNRKRFCGECKLNVYNLSGISRDEAENLIRNAEGRLCVRYFQRADGTVITEDCPVGWAKVKQRTRVFVTAAFSLAMALFTGVLFASFFSKPTSTNGKLQIPFTTPTPAPMMGAIAISPNGNSNNAKPPAQSVMGDIAPRPNVTSGEGPKAIMGKMRAKPPVDHD
ncbi:MAG: hypothetical protein ABJA02_10255 [Acidobacteriota bacterium]